jgi:hypothetical protein
MQFIPFVVTLLLTLVAGQSDVRRWGIVDHSPSQTVSLGQDFSLYCTVGDDNVFENDDWKECTWTRQVGHAYVD